METITNTVLDDLWQLLEPRWCRIKGLFLPRGGTRIHVFAEHRGDMGDTLLRDTVREWKLDNRPHQP